MSAPTITVVTTITQDQSIGIRVIESCLTGDDVWDLLASIEHPANGLVVRLDMVRMSGGVGESAGWEEWQWWPDTGWCLSNTTK